MVAVVPGIAFGGGCELALACDFLFAAKPATFRCVEVTTAPTATLPIAGALQQIARFVMLGEPIPGREAGAAGIAAHVVPVGELAAAADALTRQLAIGPTRADAATAHAAQGVVEPRRAAADLGWSTWPLSFMMVPMRSADLRTAPKLSTRRSNRRRSCSQRNRGDRMPPSGSGIRTDTEVVMHRDSYVHGNSGPPLIGKTIGAVLDDVTAAGGSRLALVVAHQNVRWTYAELKERCEACARGLLALGLRPGDRVGIWAPNCAEWTLAQFATAKAGLILVNINPAYRVMELEHALRAVACRVLITATRFKTSDYIAMIRELAPELGDAADELHSSRLPELRHVITLSEAHAGCIAFESILARGKEVGTDRLEAISGAIQMDDAANIQFTSGTTGLPKGATLSHHNLINNAFFVAEATGIEPNSRVCIPVPLYHCFGSVMGNLGCVTHAATMVYPSEYFDPLKTMQAIEAERCDVLYGVPTMFIAELNHPEFSRFDLSSLRRGIMAGAPCPIEIMKEVASTMHMSEITIAYGMTETSPVSFQSSRDDPLEMRVSTVGRIQPHLEVKIVDPRGRVLPRGEAGELCTRGYSVMLGYWNDEARTKEAIDTAGWIHTGDLATIDNDGYCRIVGRIKDMVIRGGENVYPREVEEYLYGHPDIQDVQVFGVPDEKYGEELCAWIIMKAGALLDEAGVRSFCQDRIAHYKIPRYVRFVDSFPSTVTGKVQKFVMRQEMIEEFAREKRPSP